MTRTTFRNGTQCSRQRRLRRKPDSSSSSSAIPASAAIPLLLLLLLLSLVCTAVSVLAPRAAAAGLLRPLPLLLLSPPLFSAAAAATAAPRQTGTSTNAASSAKAASSSSSSSSFSRSAATMAVPTGGGGGEVGERDSVGIRGSGVAPVPKVPFCRAGADVANMWMPVWNVDSQRMEMSKRVVVFGGKGIDYNIRAGDPLSYLSDMWSLHITNTGFRWKQVTSRGYKHPSPRWQTGDSVAYGSSLVVYGGDDQTTNEVGGLGDLWVYHPGVGAESWLKTDNARPKILDGGDDDSVEDNDWTEYTRGGKEPGERREPSLTMINSTLLLQGGRVDDGESSERCDSRFFLVDLEDPKGLWREGPSFPGECGVGQTMNTVNLTRQEYSSSSGGGGGSGGDSQVRAVVFGGCKWDSEGTFSCSNDLYAYDLEGNVWEEIIPESDADAYACKGEDVYSMDPTSDEQSSVLPPSTSPTHASGGGGGNDTNSANNDNSSDKKKHSASKKDAACPGLSTARPLGRHAHASAYIESKADDVNALFVFGGRENADELTPLGDLWMFDFKTMRWSEITPGSKAAPVNRFDHSLTVWQGGVGDGVASLVVFGGETITKTGQSVYMNDVWLYTPHTGAWREVSQSECKEGASGIVRGGNWTALVALASLLIFVVVVQCFLHRMCPHYQPPARRRRRRRRKTEDAGNPDGTLRTRNGAGGAGSEGLGSVEGEKPKRGKSDSSLVTQALLPSSSSSSSGPDKPSYQALGE
ncbi:unnamed protein product [Pylaiella littoralis]